MTTRTHTRAPQRVVYYPDPTTDPYTDLIRYTPTQLAARHCRDRQLYAAWVTRQAAIAQRDRRNRRILLAVLGGLALAVVAGLALAGWFAYHTVTAATATTPAGGWLIGVALGLLLLAGLAGVGHKCITVIEHRH